MPPQTRSSTSRKELRLGVGASRRSERSSRFDGSYAEEATDEASPNASTGPEASSGQGSTRSSSSPGPQHYQADSSRASRMQLQADSDSDVIVVRPRQPNRVVERETGAPDSPHSQVSGPGSTLHHHVRDVSTTSQSQEGPSFKATEEAEKGSEVEAEAEGSSSDDSDADSWTSGKLYGTIDEVAKHVFGDGYPNVKFDE